MQNPHGYTIEKASNIVLHTDSKSYSIHNVTQINHRLLQL